MNKEVLEEQKKGIISYINKKLSKGETIISDVEHIFTNKEIKYINQKNKIVVPDYNYHLFATNKRIIQCREMAHQDADGLINKNNTLFFSEYYYNDINKIYTKTINLLSHKEKTWSLTLLGGLLVQLTLLGVAGDMFFGVTLSYLSLILMLIGLIALLFSLVSNSMKKDILFYVLAFNDNTTLCVASKNQENVYKFVNVVQKKKRFIKEKL